MEAGDDGGPAPDTGGGIVVGSVGGGGGVGGVGGIG